MCFVLAALIWQLMRAYTLSMLSALAESGSPIVEAEIINWANTKLSSAGKTSSIRSFQDSSVRSAMVIVDLVDAIKPGTINYDLMKMEGGDEVRYALKLYLNSYINILLITIPQSI